MQAHRLGWLVGAFLFFTLMIGIGSIPGQASALSARFGDKILHALAYGFMTFLFYRAFVGQRLMRTLATLCVIAVLALFDETVQGFLPYRNASLLDWCFDMGAALIMVTLLTLRS